MNSSTGIFTTTPQGRFLAANEIAARKLGYETPAKLMQAVTDIGSQIYADPAYREEMKRILAAKGEVRDYECPLLRRDGTEFWARINVLAVRDSKGNITNYQGAAFDITEAKQIERATDIVIHKLETVLSGINALIYAADMETYEIVFINKYFRSIFGDIEGKKCWQAIQGERKGPCEFCNNHKLVDDNGNPTGVIRREFFNPVTRRWYDCHDLAVEWVDGRLARLETAIDITERKQAELDLALKNDQLQAALAERDMFFSIIAHDLKSPMSGILSLTRMLDDDLDSLSAKDLRYIATEMNKGVESVFELLQDLLQWSRLRRERVEFLPEECGLAELARTSLYTTRLMAEQKNIALQSLIPPELTVVMDQTMINTVLRNVLFNAIKFTHKGGKITMTAQRSGEFVNVCVQDNGIGMNSQMLDSLFAIDKKTRQVGTEGERGTGLGLVLCKELIEKHGGRIWVESDEGLGTQVCFTLPAAD
ncbi:MAG: PAS domain-containing sensor histidine kinase, partial [Desulfonatronovibrio sp.]